MKKVLQTIVDKGRGNCMQATVASLFDLELEQVPNFIELKENWFEVMCEFFRKNGCKSLNPFYKSSHTSSFYLDALKHDGGVNGYFYAVVPSQTFAPEDGVTHAVVVDSELNIVHDPNPNQLALKLKPEDVKYVYVNKDDWYVDYDKKEFIVGER